MSNKLKVEQYFDSLGRLLNIKDQRDAELIITYLLYLIKKNNMEDEFKNVDDADIDNYLPDIYMRKYYDKAMGKCQPDALLLLSLLKNNDLETLTNALKEFVDREYRYLQRNNRDSNQKSLEDLIEALIDLKDDSSLLYCYSFSENLLYKLLLNKDIRINIFMHMSESEKRSIYSLEEYVYLKIYITLNNKNATIITNEKNLMITQFDRIYCESENSMQQGIPFEDRVIREHLNDKGIAVKLIKDNMLDTKESSYKYSREEDLRMHILKSVIAIPANASYMRGMTGSNRAIELYDLQEKHDKVMFVNASNECVSNTKSCWLEQENIDNILSYIKKDKEKYSKSIPYKKIIANDVSLSPYDYIKTDTGISNAIVLGDVAQVFRGNDAVRVKGLRNTIEDLHNKENEFEYRSLSVTDFDSNPVPYESLPIVKVNKNLKESVLKTGDLMINKNGLKIKMLLFDGDESLAVVPDGNVIIIRLDKTRINPLFLKIYLESDDGMKVLSNVAQSGTVLRSINTSRLIKIPIPAPDIDRQNEFVEKYNERINTIEKMNLEIKGLCKEYYFN